MSREPPFDHCGHCPFIIHMMDACPLTPFFNETQTYDLDKVIELFMVLVSLCPWIFSAYLFFKLVKERSIKTLIRCASHLIAHITCDIVKVIYFREQRPDGSCSLKFGLPSCHSIFAGLYTTWIILDIFVSQIKVSQRHIFVVIFMSFVPYSRIYLIYHTFKQVIYGWIIGTLFAIGAFFIVNQTKRKQN